MAAPRLAVYIVLTLAGGAALVVGEATHPAKPTDDANATFTPTDGYEDRALEGWTVRIHRDLLTDARRELFQDAWAELSNHLYRVRRTLPAKAVAKLRKVVIWLEHDNPHQDNACYHPSREWLKGNGYNPDKAKGVELGRAKTFLSHTRHQPWLILHELTHAYHDQVLGWDHAGIKAAYKRAGKAGDYEKVLIWNGREGRHYAMTNHKEYFAETTEAYFGTNDIYPFVRAELKRHDPNMVAVIESVWGVSR